MCSAYTITRPGNLIIEALNFAGESKFSPRYNIRPGDLLPLITQGETKGLSYFYWGASPGFAQNKSISEKLYNIRLEDLSETVLYRSALESRRCLIPADGFYVWKHVSKKGHIPYRYFKSDNGLFFFAGLWEEFEDSNDDLVHTFGIITLPSNEVIMKTSPRMPAILDIETGLNWLDSSSIDVIPLLKTSIAGDISGFAVSNRVNNIEIDDSSLIKPAPPADQFGNYSLFD